MGWRWYWTGFIILFDFNFQYGNWLDRQYLKHSTKADYYCRKIRKRYEKPYKHMTEWQKGYMLGCTVTTILCLITIAMFNNV